MRIFWLTNTLAFGASEATCDPAPDVLIDLVWEGDDPNRASCEGSSLTVRLHMEDSDIIDASLLLRLTQLPHADQRVLVRCNAGSNRSALVAGLILCARRGCPGTEAVRCIRVARPDTLHNEAFRLWLESVS